MKHMALILGVLVVVVAAAAYLGRAADVRPPGPVWSYARISIFRVGRTEKRSYMWFDGRESLTAETWDALYLVLGGAKPDMDVKPEVMVLNLVGARGWELLAIHDHALPDPVVETAYYFKRRN